MCLGVPGRVVETYVENDMLMGKVDFDGIRRRVCLELTPSAVPGNYVVVHVGFSLQILQEEEAKQVFSFLQAMDDLRELDSQEEVSSPPALKEAP